MIEHLKQLYPQHIATDPTDVSVPKQYVWFQTEDGPVGIDKSALSDKERSLLEAFLTPFLSGQTLNAKQTFWHNLLFSGDLDASSAPTNEKQRPFRLIHFYVKDPAIDSDSFAEAVDGLFPSETVILWETEQEGVLVEMDEPEPDHMADYENLIDAVASDFYTDLLLYAGGKQTGFESVGLRYREEKSYFRLCREHLHAKGVFYHNEQVPFLLLNACPEAKRNELLDVLLQNVEDDNELLYSIYQYLESGMNVTTAAKKLFVHRNSLQYRVDKFVEKTGLDVKSFPQAVTVYLALLQRLNER
ncbi:MAG TPA: helix-turn-helix domain-containing protein [Bacillales bacterium]|nr:helix-turn-helix domain-containing protein [Bacillales bacterium]